MTPETRAKKAKRAPAPKQRGIAEVTRSRAAKSAAGGKSSTPKPAEADQRSSPRSRAGGYSRSTEVAQVRLRPDEMADLRLVMQTLSLTSLSDALREGLRLLSREAAEVAASEEIRSFYKGAPAPSPAGVAPATADELEAADETEW